MGAFNMLVRFICRKVWYIIEERLMTFMTTVIGNNEIMLTSM